MASPFIFNAHPFWFNPLNSSTEDKINLVQSPSLDRLLDEFLKPSVCTFENSQNQNRILAQEPIMRLGLFENIMPSQMHLLSDKYSGANPMLQMALQKSTGASMLAIQPNSQSIVLSQFPVISGIRMSDIYAEPKMISPEPQSPVRQFDQEAMSMPPHDGPETELPFQVSQEPLDLNVLPVGPPMRQLQQGQSSGPTFVRQRQQSGSFPSFNHTRSVSDPSSILSRRGSNLSSASSEGSSSFMTVKPSGSGSISKTSQLFTLHDLKCKFDCPRCPKKYRNMNGLKYR